MKVSAIPKPQNHKYCDIRFYEYEKMVEIQDRKRDGILVCIVCNFSSVIDFMMHIRLATH